jgi:chromosome segregation ATPase
MSVKTTAAWTALLTNQARIADQAHLAALESFGERLAAQPSEAPPPVLSELAKVEAEVVRIESQMSDLAERRAAQAARLSVIQERLSAGGDPSELAALAVEGASIKRILNSPDAQSARLAEQLRREQEQRKHIKLMARELIGVSNAQARRVATLDVQIREAQARLDLLTAQRSTLADGLARLQQQRASLIGE